MSPVTCHLSLIIRIRIIESVHKPLLSDSSSDFKTHHFSENISLTFYSGIHLYLYSAVCAEVPIEGFKLYIRQILCIFFSKPWQLLQSIVLDRGQKTLYILVV